MPFSRREFLKRAVLTSGALLPVVALSDARSVGALLRELEAGARPRRDLRTTLDATIALAAGSGYRPLVWGPGEPFLVRDDLGATPRPGRTADRRSILYFGQLSDTHVVDAQTPSRADWTFGITQNAFAQRPQETLTVHVLAEMVAAVNALDRSVVTGAPCAVTVITGDLADSHATTELDWYLKVLAGGKVTANSGAPGRYEGVQAWPESTYAWHPDDPSQDEWGRNGYPAYPGLLDAAVGRAVVSEGLRTPWLSVLGNHDTTWMGSLGPYSAAYDELAVGKEKIATPPPDTGEFLADAYEPENVAAQEHFRGLVRNLGEQPGVRVVTPDARRRGYTRKSIINAHFDLRDRMGPKGHGFTEESRTTGDAWWAWNIGPAVRFIGLDTNNEWFGTDGCLPQPQWDWLERELIANSSRYLDASGVVVEHTATDRLIVVLSHHTSWTMDNTAAAPGDPTKLHTGAELVGLLLRFPNVVAWCNGHTHANTIVPHPATSSALGGGFWEINTPSCVDWGQQSRMVEVVDNRDGTLSIFTLTVDHAAPPQVTRGGRSQQNLASISRELAANPWFWDAAALLGAPTDRNTELVVKAPFDLSKVSDRRLEDHAVTAAWRELSSRSSVPN